MVHKPKNPDQEHLDELLDAALAGTFPASDPVAHLVSEAKRPSRPAAGAKGKPPRNKGE
jgi:hypothetical protein